MWAILAHRSARARLVAVAAAMFSVVTGAAAQAQVQTRLLPRSEVARLGLTRAWFAQVQLDRGRSQVERAILSGNQLFVLTTAGTLHAFDALTGETQWVGAFGNPDYPSFGPATNDTQVSILNGSTLYVIGRTDGRPTIVRRVEGAPGAAPAMSNTYCFVPTVTGMMQGYPVNEEIQDRWFAQSFGRAMVAPLVTDVSVVWSTDAGHIYVGDADKPGVRFRVETGSEIVASPAFRRPTIFVGTISGEVFAFHETTGAQLWKFACGDSILHPPAAIGARVFVTSSQPALFAIDGVHGLPLWSAPRIRQFAAASRDRVYAIDTLGALVVMDAETGATLHRMRTDGSINALVNDHTDRLYLISDQGLVQCYHEIGAVVPLNHNPPPQAPSPKAPAVETGTPVEPAARPAVPPANDNPFNAPARQPVDNPFDFGAGAGAAGGGAAAGEAQGASDHPFDR
jgi:outer membrane protein assembly factor BamB